MMLADLHIHSYFSADSDIRLEDLLLKVQKKGIDIICITDHSIYEDNVTIEYYKNLYKKPLIIRGVELSTNGGELLIFGLKNDFWKSLVEGVGPLPPVDKVVNAVDEMGAVAIWAHPFREYMERHYRINYIKYPTVKILEGLNGKNSKEEDRKALEFAKKYGYKMTGGSDAHTLSEFGKSLTLFEDDINNEQEFIEALKHGKFRPITYEEYMGKDVSSLF